METSPSILQLSNASADVRFCSSCKTYHSVSQFGVASSGKPKKTCMKHCTKHKVDDQTAVSSNWDDFLIIAEDWNEIEDSDVLSIEYLFQFDDLPVTFIELDVESSLADNRDSVNVLADLLWKTAGYRFLANSKYVTPTTITFHYYCCQDKKFELSKQDNQRDRQMMKQFNCNGNFSFKLDFERCVLSLALQHKHHPSYIDLQMATEVAEFIDSQILSRTPSEIFCELSSQEIPGFELVTQSQVYYRWRKANQKLWKRDDDQYISTQKLLQEFSGQVKSLEYRSGKCQALDFVVAEAMNSLASKAKEVAMDSTFGTNNAAMDLFTVLAEVEGSGVPLAYLFIQTMPSEDGRKHADPGAVTTILGLFLTALRNSGLRPSFFGCDKDLAEISAIRSVFSEATIQLCYWHAKRAIKTKITSTAKTNTQSYYHPEEAQKLVPHLEIC